MNNLKIMSGILRIFSYFVPLLRGGGVDCTKLSDDNFSLQDLKDRTGDWQRIAAYSDWIEARIFEESQPGRNVSLEASCFCVVHTK